MRFILNDTVIDTELPRGTPVLDFLRREELLTGTKEGCREGDCGACLVLLGELAGGRVIYQAVTSCLLPLAEVESRHLVTVEGLNQDRLTPVQQAMVDEGAIQCGFCTPGIVVALTGFLLGSERLDADDAVAAVEGNICRCTGYTSICRAIDAVCARYNERAGGDRVATMVADSSVPPYFADIPDRLRSLPAPAAAPSPGPGQTVVAGGTDAYVQRPDALAGADLFLVSRAGLAGIAARNGHVYVGAATSTEELRTSPLLNDMIPGLDRALRLVSSQPIRHRATVAGNIVNASPIGDLAIILLALDAEVGVGRDDVARTLPLRALFTGYKRLAIEHGELIHWVRIPSTLQRAAFNFEKVSKRTYLDIATVNTAACLRTDNGKITDAHVSAGGVAPTPLYLARTSASLSGRSISAGTALEAASTAVTEIAPIDDVRGSAEYRRLLLRQLVLAHFQALFGIEEGLAP